MSLRIIFMGTPDFAVPVLSEIVGHGHDVLTVYTRPPAPAGRGMALRPSPVQQLADRLGLPVRTPKSLRPASESEAFAAVGADVAVVVAYGLILPPPILAAPRLGCLNLHASLLPRWRGAAPIQRAIMAGDHETGVMVMRMEEGLDTGPVGMAERVRIDPDMTAGVLHDRLMALGADLMVRALAALERGSLRFVAQAEDGVSYARKIENTETRIDWQAPARHVLDQIRGLSPFPGAFTEWESASGPRRLKVLGAHVAGGMGPAGAALDDRLTVACGEDAVRLTDVQPAGKGAMPAEAFLRGASVPAGTRFF